MTRYVITADVAIDLVERSSKLGPDVKLVAPTLLRDDAVAALYARVRADELDKKRAAEILDGIRGLKIRLLGDRVLQAKAWGVAEALEWSDTYRATYIALVGLQADALVTGDAALANAAARFATVASFEDLLG